MIAPHATPAYGIKIKTSGAIGMGVSSPTARVHLPAGTATANTGGANNPLSIVQPYIVVYIWKRTA